MRPRSVKSHRPPCRSSSSSSSRRRRTTAVSATGAPRVCPSIRIAGHRRRAPSPGPCQITAWSGRQRDAGSTSATPNAWKKRTGAVSATVPWPTCSSCGSPATACSSRSLDNNNNNNNNNNNPRLWPPDGGGGPTLWISLTVRRGLD